MNNYVLEDSCVLPTEKVTMKTILNYVIGASSIPQTNSKGIKTLKFHFSFFHCHLRQVSSTLNEEFPIHQEVVL